MSPSPPPMPCEGKVEGLGKEKRNTQKERAKSRQANVGSLRKFARHLSLRSIHTRGLGVMALRGACEGDQGRRKGQGGSAGLHSLLPQLEPEEEEEEEEEE